jgi:NhaP-type Na+/H+ or K+/H+ antiporter
MPDSQMPGARPRSITGAFWCWVAAAVLTAAFGMLLATQSGPGTALFVQLAGVLFIGVGLAQGYLAGRLRKGNKRLATAGVGLAMASIILLAFLLLFGASVLGIAIVAAIMILLITGSALNQRPSSQQWFDSQATV